MVNDSPITGDQVCIREKHRPHEFCAFLLSKKSSGKVIRSLTYASLTSKIPTTSASTSSIVFVKLGLSNRVPENPSSVMWIILRKPLFVVWISNNDFWFFIELDSPAKSSSTDRRSYKMVSVGMSERLLIIGCPAVSGHSDNKVVKSLSG